MAWNKFGNTGGGASSGSGGTKRGGSARTPIVPESRSMVDCTRCLGQGQIGNPAVETDEDGAFTGEDLQDCPDCDGDGKVTAR